MLKKTGCIFLENNSAVNDGHILLIIKEDDSTDDYGNTIGFFYLLTSDM